MPYKDKQKQREAVRKSAAKLRAKRKGITQAVKPSTELQICVNCSELKTALAESEKQRAKLQIFYDQEHEKKKKKWRVQKKRLAQKNKKKNNQVEKRVK